MKRKVTMQEEQVFRLRHHDFGGKTTVEVAKIMSITPRRIQQVLASLKEKAPQLFPILTKRQAVDYHLYIIEGRTMIEIAENSGRTVGTVSDSITAAVAKGMPPAAKKRGMLRYKPNMDNSIKEKF